MFLEECYQTHAHINPNPLIFSCFIWLLIPISDKICWRISARRISDEFSAGSSAWCYSTHCRLSSGWCEPEARGCELAPIFAQQIAWELAAPARWPDTQRSSSQQTLTHSDCEGIKAQSFLCLGSLLRNTSSRCYSVAGPWKNYLKEPKAWDSAMGNPVLSW